MGNGKILGQESPWMMTALTGIFPSPPLLVDCYAAPGRFERFACRNASCIYCKPPGLPLFMAEWAVSSSR